MSTQRTVPVYIANLYTTEKYFDHFEVECWLDSNPTSDGGGSATGAAALYVSTPIPGQFNVSNGHWEQKDIYLFENCEIGNYYQFRSRVWPKSGGPPSTWSSWAREKAGDTVAPTQTYSALVTVVNSGIQVYANPSGVSSDTEHYEFYYGLNSNPSLTAANMPNLPDSKKESPSALILMGATDIAYVYVRAVDMSGNKQAWNYLGAFSSIGQQLIDAYSLSRQQPSRGENVVYNGGGELGAKCWYGITTWPVNTNKIAAVNDSGGHSGNWWIRAEGVTGQPYVAFSQSDVQGAARYIEVTPGDVIYFGGWFLRESNSGGSDPNSDVGLILEVTDKDKTNAAYANADIAHGTTDSWVYAENTYIVPAGKKYVLLYVRVNINGAYANAVGRFDEIFMCFVRPLSSGTIGKYGSTPPSMFNAFTYEQFSDHIIWYWNLTGYRCDSTNSSFTQNSSQNVTGLSSSTDYDFYPYWDDLWDKQNVTMVTTGGTGSPAWAHTHSPSELNKRLWIAEQARESHIPLTVGGAMTAATTAPGVSGGGDGGGDGGCLYHTMFVMEKSKGVIVASLVEVGDELWSEGDNFIRVEKVSRRQHDLWIVVDFNNDASLKVTTGHPFTCLEGPTDGSEVDEQGRGMVRACQMNLETVIPCPTGEAYVTGLRVLKDPSDKVSIELVGPHTFFASSDGVNWILTHNLPIQS